MSNTLHEEIIRHATEWVTARLSERCSVQLPGIGTLAPEYVPDYVLAHRDGTYTLMPPDVILDFRADPFLLQDKNYTTLDPTLPDHFIAPEMVAAVADLHGLDSATVLRALTEHLSSFFTQLFRGRRVQLLGLADFFISEESGHLLLNVECTPELHDALSYPFLPYEPVLFTADRIPPGTEVYDSEQKPLICQIPIEHTPTPVQAAQHTVTEQMPPAAPILSAEEITIPATTAPATAAAKQDTTPHSRSAHTRIVISVGILCLIALVLFVWSRQQAPIATVAPPPEPAPVIATVPDTLPMPVDTLQAPVAEEQPPLVTDTLSIGESLAQLARKHYGRTIDWVYIYIHNSDHLSDANNIPPGTILEIPDLSRYELKEDSADAVTEAREWGTLILNGRFTSYTEQRPTLPCNQGR